MEYQNEYNRAVEHMLDYVENNKTDQADSVMRLPASAYNDPEQWQREMDMIFMRVPILVGITNELPNPGDFKTTEFLGKPLLISRQKDGSLRALFNVCTHRGMVLSGEKSGNCSRFTCRYHGWTFGSDGRLIGIADKQKFGDVDSATLNMPQLPVYERAGLIFVILTPGVELDFDAFFGGMITDLERFDFPNWYYCGQREMFGANWKVAYDGYLEGYHFAAAHPETINARSFSNVMHFEAFGPHMRVAYPQRSLADKMGATPKDEWYAMENNGYDFVRTLFPNVSIFVAPEFTQIAQLIPGPRPNENRTILYYIRKDPPADDAEKETLIQTVDWMRNVVDEEDYKVGLRVQKGLDSGALKEVVLGRNERGNQYFHKWIQFYLEGNLNAPKPTL